MKLTLAKIASGSLLTLLINGTPVKANQPYPSQRSAESVKISQKPSINLSFLVDVVTNFWQHKTYLTESVGLITAKTGDTNSQYTYYLKTIAQSGRKFRSEISFDSQNEPKTDEYLVVSDGKRVWIYQPDAKQYTDMHYDRFTEIFLIGVSSVAFTLTNEDARNGIFKDVNYIKSSLRESGVLNDLQEEINSINGELFNTYTYLFPANTGSVKALFQSNSYLLKQVELALKSEGVNIVITEKILRRTLNPNITNQTFQFSPPRGVKKVQNLSIFQSFSLS